MQLEVRTIAPTDGDLLDLAHLAGGWPAVFSVNPLGEIWPYVTRGLTPLKRRSLIQGKIALLDQTAVYVLHLRPKGGRFYFADRGVFLADGDHLVLRFSG